MIKQKNISFFIFITIQLMLCTSSFAKNGLLIVGMGLPGSGKSTIMAELGKIYDTSHVFLEPEESTWPKFITEKKVNDNFTALMWFRSTRVPLLIQADQLRNKGQIAIVDSYYDKLLYQYIDNKNMDWLISPNNKYYKTMKEVAKLDFETLPNANFIIFFKVDYNTWEEFLTFRGRRYDKHQDLENYFKLQEIFFKATQTLCRAADIKLIVYNQNLNISPEKAAFKIKTLIQN